MTRVNIFQLYNNPSLSGTIPPELFGLLTLASFDAHGCSLTGGVPSTWSPSLQALDLSHNSLSLPLPSQLSAVTSLTKCAPHYLSTFVSVWLLFLH